MMITKFWLPFLLLAGSITILGLLHTQKTEATPKGESTPLHWSWVLILGVCFLLTVGFAFWSGRVNQNPSVKSALTVMTYNIQAANDESGEKAYERQLDVIRQVNPDILALQESDTTRISLNNNDYVRYFSSKLGYHSYYGPTTIASTFGTAILARFPLENTRSIFVWEQPVMSGEQNWFSKNSKESSGLNPAKQLRTFSSVWMRFDVSGAVDWLLSLWSEKRSMEKSLKRKPRLF